MGLEVGVYQRMRLCRIPDCTFEAIKFSWTLASGSWGVPLDLVELFCGVAAITRAWQKAGLAAVGYDVKKDALYNNLNSSEGFIVALRLVLQLGEKNIRCRIKYFLKK